MNPAGKAPGKGGTSERGDAARTIRTVLLSVVGLALAVGVGFAANAISRDSIGLASTPGGSGIRLSPAATTARSTSAGRAPSRSNHRKAARRLEPGSHPTTSSVAPPNRPQPAGTSTAPASPGGAGDRGGGSQGGSGSSGGTGGGGSGSSGGSGGGGSGSSGGSSGGGGGSSGSSGGGGSAGGHGGGDD
jgi:hypothetical protein